MEESVTGSENPLKQVYVEFYKELPLTVVQKSQNFKLEAHL